MSSNCQDTGTAQASSLLNIGKFVKAAAGKGTLDFSSVPAVTSKLETVVAAQYQAGANPSQLQSIVNANLPAAIAAAKKEAATIPGTAATRVANVAGSAKSSLTSAVSSKLGSLNSGDFFDPTRPLPGGSLGDAVALPARPNVSTVSALAPKIVKNEVTAGEVRSYLNGTYPIDNDDFAIALWIGPGKNPYLMLDQLASAKQMHNTIIKPIAQHYKQVLYGNPDEPIRIGKILYGIVSEDVVKRELRGGPTSRHLLGQAVNFSISGVEDSQVVEDMRTGVISVPVGTYGVVNGIHASLPYTANGIKIEGMRLWVNPGVPGVIGYDLP